MVRRQIPRPAIARGERVGSSRLRLYSVPAGRAPRSRRGRGSRGRAPRSRGRRTRAGPAGRGPGPGGRAPSRRRRRTAAAAAAARWDRSSAGSRPWRRAPPRPVIGKIARQLSSHRATTAPSASCARKRAGTASRPLPSTACRYSPVNTASRHSLTSDGAWVDRSTRGWIAACGSTRPAAFPTSHHFAPLPGIIAPAEGPSMGKSHVVHVVDALGRAPAGATATRVRGGDESACGRVHGDRRRRGRVETISVRDRRRRRVTGVRRAASRRSVRARRGGASAWAVASGSRRPCGAGHPRRTAGSSRR